MNIIDYVSKNTLTMKDSPLNEVDSLVLSQLSYLYYEKVALPCKISDLTNYFYDLLGTDRDDLNNLNLLEKVCSSKRFSNIIVNYYISKDNLVENKQFSAVTFFLETGDIYIAYRGTDGTVNGWKEDFNMSFLSPVPAQVEALKYLETVLSLTNNYCYIGGHSKGGNLAFYAAIYLKDKRRIKKVFSHDGPGFQEKVVTSKEFKNTEPLLYKTVPESSIIGMLLCNSEDYTVVKSNESGIMQHDPFSWLVNDNSFIYLKRLTKTSIYTNKVLKDTINNLTKKEKEEFVKSLFTIFDRADIKTLKDLSKNWYKKIPPIIKSMESLDDKIKKCLWYTIKVLVVFIIKNLPFLL